MPISIDGAVGERQEGQDDGEDDERRAEPDGGVLNARRRAGPSPGPAACWVSVLRSLRGA